MPKPKAKTKAKPARRPKFVWRAWFVLNPGAATVPANALSETRAFPDSVRAVVFECVKGKNGAAATQARRIAIAMEAGDSPAPGEIQQFQTWGVRRMEDVTATFLRRGAFVLPPESE